MRAQRFIEEALSPGYHHTTIYQIYPRSFYDSNGEALLARAQAILLGKLLILSA